MGRDIPPLGEHCQPPKGERQGKPVFGIIPAMGNVLRSLRLSKGWSHQDAAEAMGLSRGQFIKLERGERKLTEQTIELASRAFGVSKAEVLGERHTTSENTIRPNRGVGTETERRSLLLHSGELLEHIPATNSDGTIRPVLVEIPEIEVRLGASYAGGIVEGETVASTGTHLISRDPVRAYWGIPLPFLRDELHLQPGRVHIVAVRGDSMADALFDGDRAIVDLEDIDVSQGGIFALKDDNGSVIVKQVELIRGGDGPRRIRCKSRNTNYEPFELLLIDPVMIIGRVASKITRL